MPEGRMGRTRCNCYGAHLTVREVDVLLLIAAGMHDSEIAWNLHISPRTVDQHVTTMRTAAARETDAS